MQNVAKAKLSYARISPRKVKIVIDLIRNKPVGEALAILKLTPKAASPIVEKLLLSAMANAETNHGMDIDKLYVAEIFASAGPILKRIQPRAQWAERSESSNAQATLRLFLRKKEEATPVKKEEPEKKARKPRAKKTAEVKAEASEAAAE